MIKMFEDGDVEKLKDIFSWEKTIRETFELNEKRKLFAKDKNNKEITHEKLVEILASIHRSENFIMDKISSNLKGIINF